MPALLSPDEIAAQLADLPGWRLADGALRRSIVAPDFPSAIAILDDVAVVAEEMDHHPDVDLRWRTLHVALSTALRRRRHAARRGAGAPVLVDRGGARRPYR